MVIKISVATVQVSMLGAENVEILVSGSMVMPVCPLGVRVGSRCFSSSLSSLVSNISVYTKLCHRSSCTKNSLLQLRQISLTLDVFSAARGSVERLFWIGLR